MKRLCLASILLVTLLVACSSSPSYSGAVIDPPKAMPDFTLQSATGPVSLSEFKGKYVPLFFGYTNCGDLCPTTMANLNYAVQGLGDKASEAQPIFISVDYLRDTPDTVTKYAHLFNPSFIGLTGTKDEIDKVTGEYGIFYELGPKDASGNYQVQHTSSVLVLDPSGKLVLTWPQGTTAEQMKQDLQTLVGG